MTPIDASDERHLVLVPHQGERDLHDAWVYNRADPDAARVVWAREPSPEALPGLLRHFAHRRAWRLEADRTLTPIAPGTPAAMPSTTQAARAPGPDSAARD